MNYKNFLSSLEDEIKHLPSVKITGKVEAATGIIVKCSGLNEHVSIGSRCNIINNDQQAIESEVVGFTKDHVLLMPYGDIEGIGSGMIVEIGYGDNLIYPDESWLGRIVDGLGRAADGKGPLKKGSEAFKLKKIAPAAGKRQRVGGKIDTGIKAIDSFVSCCDGQRMGIFAGSGVGKSVLISMLTKYADTEIKVIGLIGERGREAKEFIEEYLGPEGLKKAVIILATGDESALLRKRAAYMTMAVAEYFQSIGKRVLCIMDSVTRFAMAMREIGLASGEPPTSKGYTPSVFSELPKLLERAGPGVDGANITALFTVLVEGDDQNEPISDAVRGILDGHIILDRKIAERGRFPAIDVLKSVSRMMPRCNSEIENKQITFARRMLSTYEDMSEMIRLGAYKQGSNVEVDNSIQYYKKFESFFAQSQNEHCPASETFAKLADITGIK